MAKKAALAGPGAPSLQALRKQRRSPGLSWSQLLRLAAAPLAGLALAAVGHPLWRRWRAPRSYRQVLPVPRLDALSSDAVPRFFELYRGRSPVVLENAVRGWPASNWTVGLLAELCPTATQSVYRYDLQAAEWAALRQEASVPFPSFLAEEFGPARPPEGQGLYGLEMSLRNECPRLLEDVRIPAFFMDDLLVRHYRMGAWPTLIAGPRGTRSGLHVDSHDLPFWMALLSGRKRWRVFAPSEPALEPLFVEERNGFDFDPFAPDFVASPSLGDAVVYEHELEAGQLMYIPNGAAHAARNLEDALAISVNFLEPQSLERHRKVTCNSTLWSESRLCWFYDEDFARHKAVPLERLREVSFYEYAGFSDVASWCADFVPFLREKSARRALKYLPIVEEYCAAKRAGTPPP